MQHKKYPFRSSLKAFFLLLSSFVFTPFVAAETDTLMETNIETEKAEAKSDDAWQFDITPYLFLPNVKADISTPVESGRLKMPFSKIDKMIDQAYFLQFVASKNQWISMVNAQRVKLKKSTHVELDKNSEDASGTIRYTSIYAATGYHFQVTEPFTIDLLGGARYTRIKDNFSLARESVQLKTNWFTPMLQLRTKYEFTPNFNAMIYANTDVFSSNRTWIATGVLNYYITKHWIADAGYQWQHVKSGTDLVKTRTRLHGFLFGVTYRF